MTTINVRQMFSSFATLGENTRWEDLTPAEVQVCMSSASEMQRAGAEYTTFVKNGYRSQIQVVDLFRDMGELTISIPALPRPTLNELRKKFPEIRKENGIKRDDSPTTPVTLHLASVLIPGEEECIEGEKYERRLLVPRMQGLLLGYQQAVWLVEHQDEFPALMALREWVCIDFPGLIVVDEGGRRCVFCLGFGGKFWHLSRSSLSNVVTSHMRTAFSGPDLPIKAGKPAEKEGRPEAGTGAINEILNDALEAGENMPFCPACGHVVVRNGACFKCLNCGESLGCS